MDVSIREAIDTLGVGTAAPFDRNRFKTPAEFARETGWPYKYVLKLVKMRGFPAFRPCDDSPRLMIDTAKLREWLEKQSKKPKRPLGM